LVLSPSSREARAHQQGAAPSVPCFHYKKDIFLFV
jgi:hypothetical protein